MGLLERHGEGLSQVRAKMIPTRKKGVLRGEVRANVVPGSVLYSDAFGS